MLRGRGPHSTIPRRTKSRFKSGLEGSGGTVHRRLILNEVRRMKCSSMVEERQDGKERKCAVVRKLGIAHSRKNCQEDEQKTEHGSREHD